jgi:hypothetical protein
MTSAVAFLATLPFVATRPTVFVAQAHVVPPPGVDQSRPAADVLGSDWREALPAVVERVNGQPASDAELAEIADATTISMGRGKAEDYVALSIESRDSKTAEQLSRALAEEICERRNRELPSPAIVADEDVSEARRCAEVLRDEARRELGEFKALIAEEEKRASPPVASAPSEPKTAAALVVNPAWGNLKRELLDLDVQKSKLLEVYTEQHPRVAHLEAQREELARRLAQTPQQIESGSTDERREQPRAPIQPAPSPEAIAKRQQQLARLAELERALADAERRVAEAFEAERLAGAKQAAPSKRWLFLSYTNAEARVASRASAPLGWLGMISLLTGSMVALGVVGIRPTFESAAEARALLSVPVVGVIPADDPVGRGVSVRTWAAGLVGIAEWAVIGVAVLLAVANWRQPGFARKLLADPVTVLATPAEWMAGPRS